ncbi:MAG: hypothetical protein ACOZNI_24390 [Myxococcota bacterium]
MQDWSVHVVQLAARGELGHAGRGRLLDLPALAQPFACVTSSCTPGMRARDARSCCADLVLAPSPEERAAIDAAADEIAAHMADDPRWARGAPARWDGDDVTRPGRRCVYARLGPDGLSCGLHSLEDATGRPRGALKPMACRLFPLVLVEVDARTELLTAIHRRTTRYTSSYPAGRYKCLGARDAPSLAASCADTVASMWGPAASRRVVEVVDAWARG